MPRVVIKGQRNDLVWSQLLTEGMLIVTDCDCLEVLAIEVVADVDPHGDSVERVDVTLASVDGTVFDRSYPIDHLVPTVPRPIAQAA